MKEKKATKVILWACDVYGPKFINNQLLMDWHASNGTSPLHHNKRDTFLTPLHLLRLPRPLP